MKHTDVLLGIQTPDTDEEGKKLRKQRLDYLTAKLQLVQALDQHEGWKLFAVDCKAEQLRIMSLIETCNDPTTLAKLNGMLLSITSFMDWPAWVSREVEAMARESEKPD